MIVGISSRHSSKMLNEVRASFWKLYAIMVAHLFIKFAPVNWQLAMINIISCDIITCVILVVICSHIPFLWYEEWREKRVLGTVETLTVLKRAP